MAVTTSSQVEASRQGVIIVRFTEWENGAPVPPGRQKSARYMVIDANGPPVVRFRGDSPDAAWGFLHTNEEQDLVMLSDEELDARYLKDVFRASILPSAGTGGGLLEGKVTIVDPGGRRRKRQFFNPFVAAGEHEPTSVTGATGLTILYGAESFAELRLLKTRLQQANAVPTVRRVPRPR